MIKARGSMTREELIHELAGIELALQRYAIPGSPEDMINQIGMDRLLLIREVEKLKARIRRRG